MDAEPKRPEVVAGFEALPKDPKTLEPVGLGVAPPDPNKPPLVVLGGSVLAPKIEVVPLVGAAPNFEPDPSVADGVVDSTSVPGDTSPVSMSSSLAVAEASGALLPASLRADPKADPNMDEPEGAGAVSFSA